MNVNKPSLITSINFPGLHIRAIHNLICSAWNHSSLNFKWMMIHFKCHFHIFLRGNIRSGLPETISNIDCTYMVSRNG